MIASVLKYLPPEADAKKAISNAYPFGARKWWPYRIWREEVRATLGMPPLAPHRKRGSKSPSAGRLVESDIMPCMRQWARDRGLIR